jgi:hypothetical protein
VSPPGERRQFSCFVASAFQRPDVDAFYDECVKPRLAQLGVHCSRVDREEKNQDIDDLIFSLLDAADLVIADLTYARPSVYYEAGYAVGRGKPVIFTVRADHFVPRPEDPLGLLRVHFDLQMKNIITWATPDDDLGRRLQARARAVLRPLAARRAGDQEVESGRLEFARLSPLTQRSRLERFTRRWLGMQGFLPEIPWKAMSGLPFARNAAGQRVELALHIVQSATQRLLNGIERWGRWSVISGGSQPAQLHFVVASVAPIPTSRLRKSLTGFRPIDEHSFVGDGIPTLFHRETAIFVHVISGVKSEAEFADRLVALLTAQGLAADPSWPVIVARGAGLHPADETETDSEAQLAHAIDALRDPVALTTPEFNTFPNDRFVTVGSSDGGLVRVTTVDGDGAIVVVSVAPARDPDSVAAYRIRQRDRVVDDPFAASYAARLANGYRLEISRVP